MKWTWRSLLQALAGKSQAVSWPSLTFHLSLRHGYKSLWASFISVVRQAKAGLCGDDPAFLRMQSPLSSTQPAIWNRGWNSLVKLPPDETTTFDPLQARELASVRWVAEWQDYGGKYLGGNTHSSFAILEIPHTVEPNIKRREEEKKKYSKNSFWLAPFKDTSVLGSVFNFVEMLRATLMSNHQQLALSWV